MIFDASLNSTKTTIYNYKVWFPTFSDRVHLWVPYCNHGPPCSRKIISPEYHLIKRLENQTWHNATWTKWLWKTITAIF